MYLAEYELQGKKALGFSLNGRRYVGDLVWLVHETPYDVTRRAAYLVDVAAEGGKFKYLTENGKYAGVPFDHKHDDDGPPIALDKLNDRPRVQRAVAPCGERCTGVNWYCWRNPLAYNQTSGTDDEDAADDVLEAPLFAARPTSREEEQDLPQARDGEKRALANAGSIEQRARQDDSSKEGSNKQDRHLSSEPDVDDAQAEKGSDP